MELIEIRKRLQRAREDVAFWSAELTKRENDLKLEQLGKGNLLTVVDIKNLIDKVFDVDIASKSRHREQYVYPRAIYAHLCKEYTNASLEAIGAYIGRNHATMINSKRTFDDLVNNNYIFSKMVKEAMSELQKLIQKRTK